jgi:hypothetical protein
MKFTVLWRPFAEKKLTEIWTTASNRTAVTRTADSIDFMLAHDPDQLGKSRFGNTRILIVDPLSVYYEVQQDDGQVWVIAVWKRQT